MAFTNLTPREVFATMTDRTTGDPLNAAVSVSALKDGSASAPGGGTLRLIGAGAWGYTPTSAEWNGNALGFFFEHATGITQPVSVYPDTQIVSGLNDFNAATDAVANVDQVTLCLTTTINSDMVGTTGVDTSPMRGTDLAALAIDYTALRATKLDNLDATISSRSTLTAAGVWDPSATTMIEDVGGDRFTVKALELAPTGSGGGGGGANRTDASGPAIMEIPDPVATTTYRLIVLVFNSSGVSVNADALPTIAVTNALGVDRSANFNGTVQNPETGKYTQDYDVADTHAVEQLNFQWEVIQAGDTILAIFTSFASDAAQAVIDANVVTWRGVQPASLDGNLVRGTVDKIDAAVQAALTAAIWDYLAVNAATVGSLGKIVADNVDATISSRAVPGDEMNLSVAEEQAIAAAVMASTIDTTIDLTLAVRAIMAVVLGQSDVTGSTVEFKDRANATAVTVSVDPNTEGKRTASAVVGE